MGRVNTNLLQQPSLLNNVRNSFHLDAFYFVDVLEGVQLSSLLMLHYADLEQDYVQAKTTRQFSN
jgi:hypothetical protein